MPRCPQCGQLVSIHDRCCSACGDGDSSAAEHARGDAGVSRDADGGHLIPDDDIDARNDMAGRVPIARFTNAAEAGYFSDEVARSADIEVVVLAREQFDGLQGIGSTDFLLLVSESEAQRAADCLRQLVAGTDDPEACGAAGPASPDLEPIAACASSGENVNVAWVPLLLTLAAGSIAYWGVQRFDQRRQPAVDRGRREPLELWRALGTNPWVQKLGDGPGMRRLQVSPDLQSISIHEDRDGDGRFERSWEY